MLWTSLIIRFWTKADIDFFMQTFCVTDLP